MYKIILVLFAVLFSSLISHAQDSIYFNYHYSPQTVYHHTVNQKMNMEINFDGSSQEVLDTLKEKGMTNPTLKNNETNMELVVTTGPLNKDNRMPVVMDVAKAAKEGKSILPAGTKVYGTATTDRPPSFDSIASSSMDKAARQQTLQILQSAFSQISLPKAKMKIGDSYTQNMPIRLPVKGVDMSMKLSVVYKLTDVTENIAHFDMVATISLNATESSTLMVLKGGGDGKGTMLYDIKNGFPVKHAFDFTIKVNAAKDGFVMNMLLNSSSLSNCTISRNK